jgi:uncharacterized protein (DUF433 family)
VKKDNFFGRGIYTLPTAGLLLGSAYTKIYPWLAREDSRIFEPQLPKVESSVYLSFRDLIELRMFLFLRKRAGLSLQSLRKAFDLAQNVLNQERPFSSAQFKTDGRTLFLRISDELGRSEPRLLDLINRKFYLHEIIRTTFIDSLEYDQEMAIRWWPETGKKSKKIVIDPTRSFGKPILNEFGIPTETIFYSYCDCKRDTKTVSNWFDIPQSYVKEAVNYESKLRASLN